MGDQNINLPDELKPTLGLRIVEYDLNNVQINDMNANVDVQIWDASGDDKYSTHIPNVSYLSDTLIF